MRPSPRLDEVRVGGAVERVGEAPPPPLLPRAQRRRELPNAFRVGRLAAVLARGEDEHRLAPREVVVEHAGRREVLDEVQAPGPLGLVHEAAVPVRVAVEAPVRPRRHRGQPGNRKAATSHASPPSTSGSKRKSPFSWCREW